MDTDIHAHPSRRIMLLVYVGSILVPFAVALLAYLGRMAISAPEPRVNSSLSVSPSDAQAPANPPVARHSAVQNP